MDPAFDKPPDNKYICTICNARGQHFKSLCPRNTDPYCLTQKRNAVGTYQSVTSNETIRNKLQEIYALKSRLERGESVDLDMELAVEKGKRDRSRTPKNAGTRVKRVRIEVPEALGESVKLRDTIEKPDSVKILNAHLQRLDERYGGSLTEVVNPIRRRPTAVDMWEKDDMRRLELVDRTMVRYVAGTSYNVSHTDNNYQVAIPITRIGEIRARGGGYERIRIRRVLQPS
jgi:hypothetical protein